MSSGQSSPMESASGGPPACPHHGDGAPEEASANKKLWRAMQAVYLLVVKKHQPKLAALGVHLHHLLSISSRRDRHRRRSSLAAAARDDDEHPALATFLSSLSSCRSMDPAGAVVHPYPRRRVSSSSLRPAAPSSLSCRSMDPAAAVCQYQYRPREVEFSCKSTPMHKRRRREQRLRRQQERAAAAEQGRRWDTSSEPEYYHYRGSAAAVSTLFALMDVEEEAAKASDLAGYNGDDLDLDGTVAALTMGPAARQVRITDSPYLLWDDDSEEGWGAVDRRADEFITSFYEQLRTQQPRAATARYLTR
ncbi:unnamed protein product [Urochloa decumbens]|uniref:Uncharacterized protein n=1 Tax=Urochloa decumbens TaxID=240449 RepID=A0ABC8WFY2_9POAL